MEGIKLREAFARMVRYGNGSYIRQTRMKLLVVELLGRLCGTGHSTAQHKTQASHHLHTTDHCRSPSCR